MLRVGNNLQHGDVVPARIHSATTAMLAAAVAVGLVVALGAAIESRREFSESAVGLMRRGVAAVAIATLVAVLAGGWVAAGDPVARVRHGWDTFKGGYAANSPTGSRLTSGLGSNRYDFYRVALNEFAAHPLVGIGADNFQQQYLVHGRSDETPTIRTASSCARSPRPDWWGRCWRSSGLGAALLAAARAAATRSAGARSARPRRGGGGARRVRLLGRARLVRLVLGVRRAWARPAFALLGLACALAPRAPEASVAIERGAEPRGMPGRGGDFGRSAPAPVRPGLLALVAPRCRWRRRG